jgi:hypothetical protein
MVDFRAVNAVILEVVDLMREVPACFYLIHGRFRGAAGGYRHAKRPLG